MNIQAPRGTRDLEGDLIARFQRLESVARRLFAVYGYEEIRTPMFEADELFTRSVGEVTDIVSKEMYAFTDRKGRKLALRPEGTASVARAFIEHGWASRGRTKLWYAGPMFRYERPQGGRYRQFFQVGVELLGVGTAAADLETIDLAARLLEELGIPARLRLNHLGCGECKSAYGAAVQAFFAARQEALCPDCRDRLRKNPLRVLDCKVETCRAAATGAPAIALCATCAAAETAVTAGLAQFGLEYDVDRRLVRGLDYYTGVVYEMTSAALGAQDAVLGGGRYDNLIEELGGPKTPAVGFAAGLDRLAQLLPETAAPAARRPWFYVIGLGAETQAPAAATTRLLRRVAISRGREEWVEADLQARSLKASLRRADKLAAEYAIIIGENEVVSGAATLRAMRTGAQAPLAILGRSPEEAAAAIETACGKLAAERV